MRALAWLVAVSLSSLSLCDAAFADDDVGARVTAIVKPAVDAGQLYGVAVGVIDPKGGAHVFGFGRVSSSDARPPDDQTLFEIGSVSKVYTSLLLADAVTRKLVALDDPIKKYLPPTVKVPSSGGREITLQHLATHTSGLPRMPNNFHPKDPLNPYVDYTVEQLYAFLSRIRSRDPGAVYDYSNFGAALLGHVLELAEKQRYAELLAARVTGPLAMASTRIELSPAERARLAEGHDESGRTAPPWDQPLLPGAGGIRSTVSDQLAFLRANLKQRKSPLEAALALMLIPRHDTEGGPPGAIGLGWCVRDVGRTVWHNGQTGGYHSYVAFDPVKQWGVVLLASSASGVVDGLGYGLLRRLAGEPVAPLPKLEPLRATVKLAAAQLDALVGVYEASPAFAITVSRDGDGLQLQATNQPSFKLFAASDTHFFLKAPPAELDFVRAPTGGFASMVLHQNGRDLTLKRK
jgi:CubicO group peptidase (beta-lactamase class C family)